MTYSNEFLMEVPFKWYEDTIGCYVILDSPLQYGEWLHYLEIVLHSYGSCWAIYKNSLDTYEPYLKFSDEEKNEFKKRTNDFIRMLVKSSISKRLAGKLVQSGVDEGRQQIEFLKKYMNSKERRIEPAVLQFADAIHPMGDFSPLERYDILLYSKYITLDDLSKGRLLYAALGKPYKIETKLEEARNGKFKFTDLENIVDMLEYDYLEEKKKLESKRKRRMLSCTYCNGRGHLEPKCFKKLNSCE